MHGWITRKISQISVSRHKPVGIGLHSSELENTALTVTNPSRKKTKEPRTQNIILSTESYFDVPKILASQDRGVKIIRGPSTP